MDDIPTMIACPTPPAHQHQHQHHSDRSYQHRRDASDTSSMMDWEDDCNVSILSLGGTCPSPQHHNHNYHRKHRIRPAEEDYLPATPTFADPRTGLASLTNHQRNNQIALSPTTTNISGSNKSSGGGLSPIASSSSSSNVRVNVGGEGFSFSQTTFRRALFAGLPWKTDVEGVHHLSDVSPAVFEVLLDYTLFGTLPAYDTLCDEEFREFETIALSLVGRQPVKSSVTPKTKSGSAAPVLAAHTTNAASTATSQQEQHHYDDLMRLIEHFDRKDSYFNKELRRLSPRRNSDRESNFFMVNGEQQTSPTVTRFLGAICSVLPSRRRPLAAASITTNMNTAECLSPLAAKGASNGGSPLADAAVAKRLKLTHGQSCASSQDVM